MPKSENNMEKIFWINIDNRVKRNDARMKNNCIVED